MLQHAQATAMSDVSFVKSELDEHAVAMIPVEMGTTKLSFVVTVDLADDRIGYSIYDLSENGKCRETRSVSMPTSKEKQLLEDLSYWLLKKRLQATRAMVQPQTLH